MKDTVGEAWGLINGVFTRGAHPVRQLVDYVKAYLQGAKIIVSHSARQEREWFRRCRAPYAPPVQSSVFACHESGSA
jgi:hypothetical protein